VHPPLKDKGEMNTEKLVGHHNTSLLVLSDFNPKLECLNSFNKKYPQYNIPYGLDRDRHCEANRRMF
jgi:hypothetical protein